MNLSGQNPHSVPGVSGWEGKSQAWRGERSASLAAYFHWGLDGPPCQCWDLPGGVGVTPHSVPGGMSPPGPPSVATLRWVWVAFFCWVGVVRHPAVVLCCSSGPRVSSQFTFLLSPFFRKVLLWLSLVSLLQFIVVLSGDGQGDQVHVILIGLGVLGCPFAL